MHILDHVEHVLDLVLLPLDLVLVDPMDALDRILDLVLLPLDLVPLSLSSISHCFPLNSPPLISSMSLNTLLLDVLDLQTTRTRR